MHISFTLPALLLLAALQPVSGWGQLGHRTVAYLAQSYFTDTTAEFVDKLLANDKGYDISDASLFADRVKRQRPLTDVWHYIDAADDPPRHCGVNYKRDCNSNKHPGCIVSAITAMTKQMDDRNATLRKEALMFLIHFLGDIHQPLHTEKKDRGGNDIHVCFDGNCNVNLHAVWDTVIPVKHVGLSHEASREEEQRAAKKWAEKLRTKNAALGLSMASECHDISTPEDCALKWAGESNRHICSYVLKQYPFGNTPLEDDYYKGAEPIVDDLIGKAGLRLAAWINALAKAKARGRSHAELVLQEASGGHL